MHIWGCWVFYSRRCTKFPSVLTLRDIWPVNILSPSGNSGVPLNRMDVTDPDIPLRCWDASHYVTLAPAAAAAPNPPTGWVTHARRYCFKTKLVAVPRITFILDFFLLPLIKDKFIPTWKRKKTKQLSVTENKSRLWQIKVTSMS